MSFWYFKIFIDKRVLGFYFRFKGFVEGMVKDIIDL